MRIMKIFITCTLILGLTLSCAGRSSKEVSQLDDSVGVSAETQIEELSVNTDKGDDKEVILQLIRGILMWSDEEDRMWHFPGLKDVNSNLYTGLDPVIHTQNLKNLESTGFFSKEFLDNYNGIYRTIDEKLKNKELEWLTGEMPPFGENVDPWCGCQDIPYDNPNPRELIEVEVISLDDEKGELNWKWGSLGPDVFQGWRDFRYKFIVVKEDGVWKITYLQGFDFDIFTNRNY